eukprot:UN27051
MFERYKNKMFYVKLKADDLKNEIWKVHIELLHEYHKAKLAKDGSIRNLVSTGTGIASAGLVSLIGACLIKKEPLHGFGISASGASALLVNLKMMMKNRDIGKDTDELIEKIEKLNEKIIKLYNTLSELSKQIYELLQKVEEYEKSSKKHKYEKS